MKKVKKTKKVIKGFSLHDPYTIHCKVDGSPDFWISHFWATQEAKRTGSIIKEAELHIID